MTAWQLPPSDLRTVFSEMNPWHGTGLVPSSLAPPAERPPARVLWQRLLDDDLLRYQLIIGPRRVGKTTVLYQTVRRLLDHGVDPWRIWWLRMDHPLLSQTDLGRAVRTVLADADASFEHPVYLMMDELVYADRWDLWLKTFYDDRWPVRVAATSSTAAARREGKLESGVGRWSEQYMGPCLFSEYLTLSGRPPGGIEAGDTLAETLRALPGGRPAPRELQPERRRYMLVGGFPQLYTRSLQEEDPDEQSIVLRSQQFLRSEVVERAIYKDAGASSGGGNPKTVERILYVFAGQITGILSPARICSEQGISQPTFERYLSYFERTFLVFTLPNFSGREANIQRRGRKLYFVDGAVRNAVLQRGAPLEDTVETGLLLENLAASSLHALAVGSGVRLHHWRDGNKEVDLIFDHPTSPLAFEIASSPNHSRAGLRSLIQRHERFRGGCYLVAPQAVTRHPDESGIGVLPLDLLLLAVGAHTRPPKFGTVIHSW